MQAKRDSLDDFVLFVSKICVLTAFLVLVVHPFVIHTKVSPICVQSFIKCRRKTMECVVKGFGSIWMWFSKEIKKLIDNISVYKKMIIFFKKFKILEYSQTYLIKSLFILEYVSLLTLYTFMYNWKQVRNVWKMVIESGICPSSEPVELVMLVIISLIMKRLLQKDVAFYLIFRLVNLKKYEIKI